MRTIDDPIHTSIPPSRTEYFATYIALLLLLALTTGLAYVDLGPFNIVVALLIAGAKAALVIWFFMHFRTANKLILILFGSSLAMLFIAFLLTLVDYTTR